MDRYKVSKTGDCRKLLGQPYGRNASSMTKIRSMFTLICCSLAGLKMSLSCRNVLAQDKIKAHRKLYLSLPHIGILGGPQSKLHASSAVLGWGLATACSIGMAPSHLQIFYTFSPANFSPAVLGWRLLTCSFFLADFSHAVLGWHRPGLPNSPQKKIINGIMAVLPQRLHVSR